MTTPSLQQQAEAAAREYFMVGSTLTVSPKAVEALVTIILKHLAPLEAQIRQAQEINRSCHLEIDLQKSRAISAEQERDEARWENQELKERLSKYERSGV